MHASDTMCIHTVYVLCVNIVRSEQVRRRCHREQGCGSGDWAHRHWERDWKSTSPRHRLSTHLHSLSTAPAMRSTQYHIQMETVVWHLCGMLRCCKHVERRWSEGRGGTWMSKRGGTDMWVFGSVLLTTTRCTQAIRCAYILCMYCMLT